MEVADRRGSHDGDLKERLGGTKGIETEVKTETELREEA